MTYSGIVHSVSFSPDGKLIATGLNEETARIINISSEFGKIRVIFHEDEVYQVDFSPDGILFATGSWDCSAKITNTVNGLLVREIRHSEKITSVRFSPNGL
mmetsp:Transcript_12146/g.10324  ORF Transcript_12146/g.10324 Transcript_12146/m.10324 type:complete len:101 (-) Transcript_12146:356-658(-)